MFGNPGPPSKAAIAAAEEERNGNLVVFAGLIFIIRAIPYVFAGLQVATSARN